MPLLLCSPSHFSKTLPTTGKLSEGTVANHFIHFRDRLPHGLHEAVASACRLTALRWHPGKRLSEVLRHHRKNLPQGVVIALLDEPRELGRPVRGDSGDVFTRDAPQWAAPRGTSP